MKTYVSHGLASAFGDVGPLRAHRDRCLRCQADDARLRTLARDLAAIGTETTPAPEWLVDAVMGDLDRTSRVRGTTALVTGLVAGFVAAATAVIVAVRHRARTA